MIQRVEFFYQGSDGNERITSQIPPPCGRHVSSSQNLLTFCIIRQTNKPRHQPPNKGWSKQKHVCAWWKLKTKALHCFAWRKPARMWVESRDSWPWHKRKEKEKRKKRIWMPLSLWLIFLELSLCGFEDLSVTSHPPFSFLPVEVAAARKNAAVLMEPRLSWGHISGQKIKYRSAAKGHLTGSNTHPLLLACAPYPRKGRFILSRRALEAITHTGKDNSGLSCFSVNG